MPTPTPTTTTVPRPEPSETAASELSGPKLFVPEPYYSGTSFFASVANILYMFVYTIPRGVWGILELFLFFQKRREAYAKEAEERSYRIQMTEGINRMVVVMESQTERMHKMAELMGTMVEDKKALKEDNRGLSQRLERVETDNTVLKRTVERLEIGMKEGRKKEEKKKRRKKERKEMREGFEKIEVKLDGFLDHLIPEAEHKKKKKNRLHQAPLPDFPSKDKAPAWGSTTTTDIESLLDAAGDLVEGKEDEDYEADKEESVYGEDDSSSTVSTTSTPDTPWEWEQAGGWKQPEDLPSLEG
ncbi:hypothetical protein N0V85_009143, partial [Neurospora sp. IMI 360204]